MHRLNRDHIQVAKAAIDAAIASGVKHIFYSSLAFGGVDLDPEYKAQVFLAHAATEAYLAELQNKNPDTFFYTIVRIGIYSESFPVKCSLLLHPFLSCSSRLTNLCRSIFSSPSCRSTPPSSPSPLLRKTTRSASLTTAKAKGSPGRSETSWERGWRG
jgi:hypothetical protein